VAAVRSHQSGPNLPLTVLIIDLITVLVLAPACGYDPVDLPRGICKETSTIRL
jgi:hypothetical protein